MEERGGEKTMREGRGQGKGTAAQGSRGGRAKKGSAGQRRSGRGGGGSSGRLDSWTPQRDREDGR